MLKVQGLCFLKSLIRRLAMIMHYTYKCPADLNQNARDVLCYGESYSASLSKLIVHCFCQSEDSRSSASAYRNPSSSSVGLKPLWQSTSSFETFMGWRGPSVWTRFVSPRPQRPQQGQVSHWSQTWWMDPDGFSLVEMIGFCAHWLTLFEV